MKVIPYEQHNYTQIMIHNTKLQWMPSEIKIKNTN